MYSKKHLQHATHFSDSKSIDISRCRGPTNKHPPEGSAVVDYLEGFAVGIRHRGEITVRIERECGDLPVLRGEGHRIAVDIPLDGGRVAIAIRDGVDLPGSVICE